MLLKQSFEERVDKRRKTLEVTQNSVAQHYNDREDGKDRSEREKSKIFKVKAFNNWVKTMLIQTAMGFLKEKVVLSSYIR